jgi:SWI/SNF-related matrix-associated actin-dependent regulator 1 of chromatin subfamily A
MTFKVGYSRKLNAFVVECGYNKTMVRQLRFLKGAVWDDERRIWTCLPSLENGIRLESLSIMAKRNGMYPQLRRSYHEYIQLLETQPMQAPEERKVNQLKNFRPRMGKPDFPEHLVDVLADYQKEGIRFIARRNGRALLADDMGLGKTLQVLAFIMMFKIERVVVVCPSTVKFNWEEECEKWGVDSVGVLEGGPDRVDAMDWEDFTDKRIVVINYDILAKWKPYILQWTPDLIVFDECHRIKNKKAKRTKAACSIAKKCTYAVGMSGTPIENNPHELLTLFNLLRPGMFDYYNYIYRYCDAASGSMGASNTDELHGILASTIMIRRLKQDVLKELPPKRRMPISVDVDLKEYNAIQKKFIQEGGEGDACLHELRKALIPAKIPAIFDWIDNFLLTNKKLIVFAHHRATLDAISARYRRGVIIYGGTPITDRQKLVRSFQTHPPCNPFIGGVTACAEGINLTASADVLMAEMIYNPMKMEQAEDRSCRKGQKLPVSVYYMVCRNTYEQAMWGILEGKRKVVREVVEGRSVEKTKNIKHELIKSLFK